MMRVRKDGGDGENVGTRAPDSEQQLVGTLPYQVDREPDLLSFRLFVGYLNLYMFTR